jgi:DNA-binding MarR family transcriptional regulator
MEKNQANPDPFLKDRSILQERMRILSGLEDISGIEIASSVAILANIFDALSSQVDGHGELSGARWGLLIRLFEEEKHGNCEGITPTFLSRARNVSKNTTSSLLRGLEEQGLIERNIDLNDRRIFRIRLTKKGRTLTESISPKRIAHLSNLSKGLKRNEREQLALLLDKLIQSLVNEGHLPPLQF